MGVGTCAVARLAWAEWGVWWVRGPRAVRGWWAVVGWEALRGEGGRLHVEGLRG